MSKTNSKVHVDNVGGNIDVSQVNSKLVKQKFTDSHIKEYTTINSFRKSAKEQDTLFKDTSERMIWVKSFLRKVRYKTIKSKNIKHEVRSYIKDVTRVTDKTISLWIHKYKYGKLKPKIYRKHTFRKIYTLEDIVLLVKVDSATENILLITTKSIHKGIYKIP